MTDPEVAYRRVVSGDPAAVRGAAETLTATLGELEGAAQGLLEAAGVPVWSGEAVLAFRARVDGILTGIQVNHAMVSRAAGALETAVAAYETAVANADHFVSFWRSRPTGLHPIVEELLARAVNARLLETGTTYQTQLAAVTAVLDGDDVDLDELDEDTREWVERGLEKNEDWMKDTGSSLGPLIPNTQATGDDRGWIPQGLGYDPVLGQLVQSYYTEDGTSTIAVIDEATGREVNEVVLGGDTTEDGKVVPGPAPGHAGGVAVDGDQVYVTSGKKVWTYSLSDLRSASPGDTVQPSAAHPVAAGSYSAFHDGRLYVGDHYGNKLYAYEKDGSGGWTPVTGSDGEPEVIETPEKVQGVVVRDGELVFSTSFGRQNESALVVQDRETGERGDPYPMPNMSEGVVEVDGELLTTYESGAATYDDAGTGAAGWLWGVPDDDGLWATQHMTRTPLSELGLTEDLEVEPGSLRDAAQDLLAPGEALRSASTALAGVRVQAHQLGDVPAAAGLSSSVTTLVDTSESSLRTGSNALERISDALVAVAHDYQRTDEVVGRGFQGLTPW
jgi:hypothetical protein